MCAADHTGGRGRGQEGPVRQQGVARGQREEIKKRYGHIWNRDRIEVMAWSHGIGMRI